MAVLGVPKQSSARKHRDWYVYGLKHVTSWEGIAGASGIYLAFNAEGGPVPRSDIWQSLHGRVTVGYVDQCLKALLKEDRIRATKVELGKPLEGPWKPGRVLTCRVLAYTATVYSVGRHDE